MPLGLMRQTLAQLDNMPVQARPTDLYDAIAEQLAR